MDILAHTLWTNYGARVGNKMRIKKGKPKMFNVGWTAFFGVFPDFFAFVIPMIISVWGMIIGKISFAQLSHHGMSNSFGLSYELYNYSHSLVIWATVFIIVWIISKRPRYELLGWALHILIDMPSHAGGFFLTPVLFPLSDWKFTNGIKWSNTYYMIINYSLLFLVWGNIFWKKFKASKYAIIFDKK